MRLTMKLRELNLECVVILVVSWVVPVQSLWTAIDGKER